MRIVIDLQGAQSSGSRNRGIGRYSLSLAKAIIRNKGEHEVIIALNGLFPETIERLRAEFNELSQDKVQVWHVIGPVFQNATTNDWRRKIAELSREAFLASLEPDIVLVTSLFEGLGDNAVTSVGLFNKTIPTAVILYDLIPLIHRNPYLNNPMVKLWYEDKLEHLKRSNLLLSISESARQEAINYIAFSQDQVTNISTAADPQFQRIDIGNPTECNIRERYGLLHSFVMYTGGIDHRKNVEGLIRAYALLPKSLRENHQLAIVCSVHAESRNHLNALAQQQGLAENEVILTGFVPEEDLIALYHLCEAFVFPSWHEGFGLPALEAMACGAAVIAANTSSLPEVVGRKDALFDPYDDEAIAEKLMQVLTDTDFHSQLVRHGLEQAKQFSWDKSAKSAIAAFEKLNATTVKLPLSLPVNRLKLAYISPLPPERSGISDYSAELLPSLSHFYDIDVVVAQETISDPWIRSHCQIRDVDWFSTNTHIYDRVLYHFGNSHFHQHMFDLQLQFPGTVVLHDFFLGHIMAHMDAANPGVWARTLYQAHGYHAVQERFSANDIWSIAWKYPCNRSILEKAKGIIVHSETSRQLAQQWLGEAFAKKITVIPLLRVPAITEKCEDARQALGIDRNAFIVSSFGILGANKQNHRLLNAWIASPLSKDKRCVLIFVGENHNSVYGNELLTAIQNSGCSERIHITGWTDTAQFRLYLAAADIGVQLRTLSRGETSAAVLDCMNYGLPTIVNANGSMADLPKDAVWMLPDEFDDKDLSLAIETLWMDDKKREDLGMRAREVILTQHSPDTCAGGYRQAIEKYYAIEQIGKNSLIKDIVQVEGAPAGNCKWLPIAQSLAQNYPSFSERQLLVDISELIRHDARSGIQRVVRSVLREMLVNPPKGFRVEPVYASPERQGYRYAREFTMRFLGCPDQAFSDETIDIINGDIFLGLDLKPDVVFEQAEYYTQLRLIGCQVYFVVYDLLPCLMPSFCNVGVPESHKSWLEKVTQNDGVICISRAVADEMLEWLTVFGEKRVRPFKLGWFHLGADMVESVSSKGFTHDADSVMNALKARSTFLMVGTVEPRKGQTQTLEAFEILWNQGEDVNLVIVGKQGWQMEVLIGRLLSHPEFNHRLFWLEGISDEYLEQVYAAASCLIASSYGEGFGLPLIEAAQHKLPIIARDIPVFEEVAGKYAFYFTGLTPEVLANSVCEWLKFNKVGFYPHSDLQISTRLI